MLIIIVLLSLYNSQVLSFAAIEFLDGGVTVRSIDENVPKGTKIGEPVKYIVSGSINSTLVCISGPDADSFDFRMPQFGSIQLRTYAPLDYEGKNAFNITFTVSDMDNPEVSKSIMVLIVVMNVDEQSDFSEIISEEGKIHRVIPENTVPGLKIGNPISAAGPTVLRWS